MIFQSLKMQHFFVHYRCNYSILLSWQFSLTMAVMCLHSIWLWYFFTYYGCNDSSITTVSTVHLLPGDSSYYCWKCLWLQCVFIHYSCNFSLTILTFFTHFSCNRSLTILAFLHSLQLQLLTYYFGISSLTIASIIHLLSWCFFANYSCYCFLAILAFLCSLELQFSLNILVFLGSL